MWMTMKSLWGSDFTMYKLKAFLLMLVNVVVLCLLWKKEWKSLIWGAFPLSRVCSLKKPILVPILVSVRRRDWKATCNFAVRF